MDEEVNWRDRMSNILPFHASNIVIHGSDLGRRQGCKSCGESLSPTLLLLRFYSIPTLGQDLYHLSVDCSSKCPSILL